MWKLQTHLPLRVGHARGVLAAFAALAACLPVSVRADTAAAEEATGPLQEITVTATRHEESLSKVPISVTALTQEAMDIRGIKDFQDIVHFTPGVNIDTSGTNNISIRGIASSGGAGTTGIYIDDTPIQIRATAFNPDDALPKAFDIDRVEVLRGPQGTLFGSGSEGGTVRYITTQPSLTTNSFYGREEVSYTQGGAISYEGGIAAGGPLIDDKLGARLTVWYRRDGGYIDNINPVTLDTVQKNANYDETVLYRLAFIWAPADQWTVTPSIYYQDRYRNNVEDYWPLYSNPGNNNLVSADPDLRSDPDRFYLAAIKVEGEFGLRQAHLEYLVLPPQGRNRLRRHAVQPRLLSIRGVSKLGRLVGIDALSPVGRQRSASAARRAQLPCAELDRQPSAEHHAGDSAAIERCRFEAVLDRGRILQRGPPDLS